MENKTKKRMNIKRGWMNGIFGRVPFTRSMMTLGPMKLDMKVTLMMTLGLGQKPNGLPKKYLKLKPKEKPQSLQLRPQTMDGI